MAGKGQRDMSADTSLEERVINLEAQIAMQNRTIDELSDALADQWQKVDTLSRQVNKLNDRLAATEGDLHTVLPQDRPPPHY
jgi:SlyX protein